MSLASNDNGFTMPVVPMGGGYGAGGYGSAWGGDGLFWIIILFLFAMMGGWGNGFGFGGNSGQGAVPYMMYNSTENDVQRGFDQAALTGGINGLAASVCNGFSDVQQSLCNGFAGVNQGMATGFAGVNAAVANGFAQAEIADNARQMANMNQAFAGQTAMAQGFNQLSSQFADCCCENRLASADLKYTIATENCADRTALADGIKDILTAQNAGFQSIKDQLCADKIEEKNDLIAQLRSELMYARGQASQDVQTAAIQAGQRQLANEVEQYVLPTPRPAYIVQNPNCCAPNYNGCGCGCAVA